MTAAILALLLTAAPSCSAPSLLPPRPTVSGWGDSIMDGNCSANTMMFVTKTLLGAGWFTINKAVPGETAAQIRARYNSGYVTACIGDDCDWVAVQGGVNSLKGGVTPAATFADMVAVVDDALARGKRVVWLDVLPYRGCNFCGSTSSNAATVGPAYNALMQSACTARASNPRLRCVFNWAAFEDPARPGQGYLTPAYDCDGIHLNPAGGQALAATISAAIQSLR